MLLILKPQKQLPQKYNCLQYLHKSNKTFLPFFQYCCTNIRGVRIENILIEVEPPLNVNNPPTSDKDNTDISDVFATCLRGFRLSWLSWF